MSSVRTVLHEIGFILRNKLTYHHLKTRRMPILYHNHFPLEISTTTLIIHISSSVLLLYSVAITKHKTYIHTYVPTHTHTHTHTHTYTHIHTPLYLYYVRTYCNITYTFAPALYNRNVSTMHGTHCILNVPVKMYP